MSLFLIIDAARASESCVHMGGYFHKEYISLYKGTAQEEFASIAPYLFSFPGNESFVEYMKREGWGNSWFILAESPISFEEIKRHFRRFLIVKTEEGKQLLFRFYDPRVLRIFLPTCDKQQLKEFFGPVRKYIVEAENPAYVLIFHLSPEGDLQTEQAEADAFFGSPDFEPASASNPPALTLPSGVPAADTGASKRKWRFLTEDDSPPQL